MRPWRQYKQTLLPDFLAGITGAVAGAPQAMGFAIVAGISPIYGLYTAIVSTIIGAVTTSSSFMTVGPTNALAVVVGSTLIVYTDGSMIDRLFVLTLLVGLFQFAFGVFRLGNLTRFVSNAVLTGFITGAGLLIILGQLNHLTGYHGASASGALPRFWDWLTHLGQSDWQTTIIGVAATIIIYSLHHTRFRSVATLTAIVITTLFVTLTGWTHVALVRDMSLIPPGLPMPILPDLRYVPEMLTAALAVAVLASVQSAAISNNVPERDGSVPNITRDFAAQGVANIVGGFFQSMPSGGSLSRTAVNVSAGARTRLANLFAGILVALVLLVFGRLIERVTLAALAGHLVVAAWSLISIDNIRIVWRVNPSARVSMLITFVSTLVFPLEYSIYIGIGLSLILYVYTSADNLHVVQLVPLADHHYREEAVPRTLPHHAITVISVSGHLYFAAIKRLEEKLPSPKGTDHAVVVLRLRDNQYLGSTGIRFLQRYDQQLQSSGSKLILAGIGEHLRDQLQRTGAIQQLGENCIFYASDVIFSATEQALVYARTLLQPGA